MKVSLNWVKEFTSADGSIDELVEKIGAQLGAVEEVIDLGKKYEGILVVKVVTCEKHPNADKLSPCLIDDGKTNKKVKRNKDGLIEVVCGAPNVKAGQLAVWIPPGATVPSSPESEPFIIEAREIRGKISNGMLASVKELAVGDSHDGILILDSGKPGDNFAKSLWLDDYIIDIENKMFTHRPDCFGQLGVAREIAGINHQVFKSPDWYREDASLPTDGRKNVLKLQVKNDLPKVVPRFCAVAFKDIKVQPSPAWMQSFLTRVGVRPINNIVDITNMVMLETGQPLHAYDYDKLKTGTLGVRLSKKGEQLKLIGGKTIRLDQEAVVITDGAKPVGLGGVMGGADTEVDANTKNIVLEAANFDMNTTRRTAMAYGLFTDAATRFTKNQSPRQNLAAIARAASQIKQFAGGRQASAVIDNNPSRATSHMPRVKTTVQFVNSRLGLEMTISEIAKLLENVEFEVSQLETSDSLLITVPFWRTDIEIPEDIVEEIGRLYGYDKLPLKLPGRDLAPAELNPLLSFKARLRDILSAAGANEVLTYSFVHGDLLKKVGQDHDQSYQIANALSPDLQYYRQGLIPSLLEKIHPNIKEGFDNFALFEIGKIHFKGMEDAQGLPAEPNYLGVVVASKTPKSGAAYYWAKSLCEYLLKELNVPVNYEPLVKETSKKATYCELPRTAEVKHGDVVLGRVSEFKPSVSAAFKLPKYCAGFTLRLDDTLPLLGQPAYQPLNRFPELEQDFCLRAPADLSYEELTNFVGKNLGELSRPHGYIHWTRALDIFQKPQDKAHKQTTWRIILSHPERTLTTDESNRLLDELAALAKTKLKAERI